MAKRLPLPVRRQMNLTDAAYTRLRRLNDQYELGNNYLLTVILEHYDEIIDKEAEARVFANFIAEYGAPKGEAR